MSYVSHYVRTTHYLTYSHPIDQFVPYVQTDIFPHRCDLHASDMHSGVLIGPNSLFCLTLIACYFEICAAHRRSLMQQVAAQDARRTVVHDSSDAVRSGKA